MKKWVELAAVAIIAFSVGAGSYAYVTRPLVEDGDRFRFLLRGLPESEVSALRAEMDKARQEGVSEARP